MSKLLPNLATLYREIAGHVNTAWGVATDRIFIGLPKAEAGAFPYAVIDLPEVQYEPDSVSTVTQVFTFQISYRDKHGQNEAIAFVKAEKADALIGELMRSASFADVAYSPRIVSVTFNDDLDPTDPTYGVTVTFECRVSETALTPEG